MFVRACVHACLLVDTDCFVSVYIYVCVCVCVCVCACVRVGVCVVWVRVLCGCVLFPYLHIPVDRQSVTAQLRNNAKEQYTCF